MASAGLIRQNLVIGVSTALTAVSRMLDSDLEEMQVKNAC
jgi:hypothetical protein